MEKFEFFFGIQFGYKLYALTDSLSKALQSQKMPAISGKKTADLTRKTVEGIRNDESFELFFQSVVGKSKNHKFIEEPTLQRKRRQPNYSILQYLDGSEANGKSYNSVSTQDYFRQIYFEALDYMVVALNERFNQPCFDAFATMEMLLLKAIAGDDVCDEINWMKLNYSNDVNIFSLETELLVFKQIFTEKANHFDDIIKVLQQTQSESLLLFPNVMTVIQLLLVNPATSATPERSFSAARRIKTWLRATMTQSRFNALSFLHSQKHLVDGLDLVPVANDFVSLSDVRYNYFGTFINADF